MIAGLQQGVKQQIRFNRAVRHAVSIGRYDLAVEASDDAKTNLSCIPLDFVSCRVAVVTWVDRGIVLELDDRLEEALRARMIALGLALD